MIEDEIKSSGMIRLHMFQRKRFEIKESSNSDMKVIVKWVLCILTIFVFWSLLICWNKGDSYKDT